jgi:peptidyl-prolyl cis-trans isomerase D
MLKSIQQRDLDRNRWIKISMTVILVLICVSMVITLIPGLFGGPAVGTNVDSVAVVGGAPITTTDVMQRLNQMSETQSVPPMLRGYYAQEVLDNLVFQHALDYEAERLSVQVSADEERQRIEQILPMDFSNGVWLRDKYANDVPTYTRMSVPQFEEAVRQDMIAQKMEHIVTDGITVSQAEIEQEFRRRNEKITIQYALIKPAQIAPTIHPSDQELAAYFQKNMSKYQIPEKRSAQYALLDLARLRSQTQVSDEALRAYYNQHIDEYKVQNSVHVEHILFKTIGKTDAEIAEIRKQAESILAQAKRGANFEDLAKKYSEDDASKPKGGDLGWVVEGQTVPEFQKVAFSLPKGGLSDLVKTEYGFHIIKVLDHQTARTKSFDEVRDSILPIVLEQKVTEEANGIADQMANAVRESDRQPILNIAHQLNLLLGDTPPESMNDPVGQLGSSPDLSRTLFELRVGELSEPIHIDTGYVILTPKQILPAHQATLAEVHDRVLGDYQQDKSLEVARAKADELAKRVQGGEPLDKAAKELGLEVKTSDPFARTGSVPDLGAASQLGTAFSMNVGQMAPPKQVGGNWLVYRITAHDPANMAEVSNQRQDIEQQLLQTKQSAAFDAFKTALENRMKAEGKLIMNPEAVDRLTHSQS